MGLEQYAGMTSDEKIIAVLVEVSGLKEDLSEMKDMMKAKPCPSPDCVKCKSDISQMQILFTKHMVESDNAIADLRVAEERISEMATWKSRRETELADSAKVEEGKEQREAWVIPMWIAVVVSAGATLISVILEIF